jgi:tryptophan synthase beta chain
MQLYGGDVCASPSNRTHIGKSILDQFPDHHGSLGIGGSEANERIMTGSDVKRGYGSALNSVMLHQTIVGQEALKQMEYAGDYPDVVIAPMGGGSSFGGISFPFLQQKLQGKRDVRCVAVEAASCPRMTKGAFMYDFADVAGYSALVPMYTLGHNYKAPGIHAGGLRWHGTGTICSQLLKDGLIEAVAIQQLECFEAGVMFAKTEGIIPAPEATHAIAQVIREANQAKVEGKSRTILFNQCGHGHYDMQAYSDFFAGKLTDHVFDEEALKISLKEIEALQPV